MPANYDSGVFENCDGDDEYVLPFLAFVDITSSASFSLPMGVYGTSTWYQGVEPTPEAHPVASSSNCVPLETVGVTSARKRRSSNGFEKVARAAFAEPTPMF